MQTAVVVLGFFVFLGQVVGQDVVSVDICYGSGTCDFQTLSCSEATVYLLKAQYGYKDSTSGCPSPNCSKQSTCCTSSGGACFKAYSSSHFSGMYDEFSGRDMYTIRGQWSDGGCTDSNGVNFPGVSSYAHIEYICLNANATTTFDSSSTTTGRAVAILYKKSQSSSSSDNISCRVDTVEGNSTKTAVMLVKGPNKNNGIIPCSSIGFNSDSLLPCNKTTLSYNFTAKFTPFNIYLSINQNSIDHASAVIHADDDVQLTVMCQRTPVATSPTPSLPYTTGSTSSPAGADNSGTSAGAIAAGVLVPILVLVAAAIALFWYFRRFRQNPTLKKSAQSKGGNLGIVPPVSLREKSLELPAPAEARQSDYAEIHDSALQPPPGYFQAELDSGPAPPAAANDVDYDKIGHKKPAAHNHGNAYGRLGEVGGRAEVTDYNYDRLARGNQAAPDVIDSDYNTPGLTSEGDYHVAGIPKKQHVISGAGYDIAEVVTSENEGNDDVTPGFSVRIGQGGANDDATRPTMTKPGSASYELSKPLTGPDLLNN